MYWLLMMVVSLLLVVGVPLMIQLKLINKFGYIYEAAVLPLFFISLTNYEREDDKM